jgi:two-component system sensor histidine kinase VicK
MINLFQRISYNKRLILLGTLIFVVAFILMYIFIIQGVYYYVIDLNKNNLVTLSQDANILILQELSQQSQNTDTDINSSEFSESLINHSYKLSHQIADIQNTRIQLYDTSGYLISDSVDTSDEKKLTTEVNLLLKNAAPVMTYKNINESNYLYFVSPIYFYDNSIIGVIAYLYPLEQLDYAIPLLTHLISVSALLIMILIFLYYVLYAKIFTNPIIRITHSAEDAVKGQYLSKTAFEGDNEIACLSNATNKLIDELGQKNKTIGIERHKLTLLLESLDDGILTLDKNGNIVNINQIFLSYFEYNNPSSIYDFEHQNFLKDIYNKLQSGEQHTVDEVSTNNYDLLIIGVRMHEEDLEEYYMIVIKNVSSSKQREKEQHKFISSVSHELRTPLASIIGYTDMLQRRGTENKQLTVKALSTIEKEGHRLLDMVNDLLDMNKNINEPFQFHLVKTNVNMNALLEDVVSNYNIDDEAESVISYRATTESLPSVFGDYSRIKQIIINIIENSIKYSDSESPITIVAHYDKDFVYVSIRDFGIGIPENELDKIFDAFYRVDEDRSRERGGAGLGLSIVKQLVDQHGGTISIESKVNEGTNVTIALPQSDII